MKHLIILIVLLLFTTVIASADNIQDTLILRSDDNVDRVSRDLDSLVNSWYVKLALKKTPYLGDSAGREYPDSVYISRLEKINSIINLPYNNIIRNHIHVYTVRQREKFSVVLGLMDYYFPMFENIFDSFGIPAELAYVAVIESALNPNAVNAKSGATGMWQFMYGTGKMLGLTINSVVDERRDPIKSTYAAARYMKDLYGIFKDWTLVIAAYNCGPANVAKAIKRSGNKNDYWDIYYKLPTETRGYLPQYIAAIYGSTYFADHKLKPLPLNIPLATDTIMVNKDIHLSQISEVMDIPLMELKALNPQYRTGFVPGSSKPYALTLPVTQVTDFIGLDDTIRNYKPETYLTKTTRIAEPSKTSYKPTAGDNGQARIIYTVKKGDNLGLIASWFRVGLSSLRSWNNIYKNTIRVGQKLVIYVDPDKSEYFSGINAMSLEEKQASVGKKVPVNSVNPSAEKRVTTISPNLATTAIAETDGEYEIYTVRRGDTIWDIVKKFDNVTSGEVLKLNGISNPSRIMTGQKLKIRKKS
jgi:membrane-bound lytic murein transglycosylase D